MDNINNGKQDEYDDAMMVAGPKSTVKSEEKKIKQNIYSIFPLK